MKRCEAFVAAGSFDAMHKGHIEVLEELVRQAGRRHSESLAICTEPEICGEEPLTTIEEKRRIMDKIGIHHVVFVKGSRKDESLLTRAGETLGKEIVPLGFVTGQGGEAWLTRAGREMFPIPRIRAMGEVVTNGLVRERLAAGRVEDVEKLCGRPYSLAGIVEHGKALGRTVGMPTANLRLFEEKQMPLWGVYATSVVLEGREYTGVTNVGRRPTVDDLTKITVETYLLDFSGDVYDHPMEVRLHYYLRGVQKFDSLEAVKAQVQRDIVAARSYWERSV